MQGPRVEFGNFYLRPNLAAPLQKLFEVVLAHLDALLEARLHLPDGDHGFELRRVPPLVLVKLPETSLFIIPYLPPIMAWPLNGKIVLSGATVMRTEANLLSQYVEYYMYYKYYYLKVFLELHLQLYHRTNPGFKP